MFLRLALEVEQDIVNYLLARQGLTRADLPPINNIPTTERNHMTENTEPAGERQDPADVKRIDTEVETEPQGAPEETLEHAEPVEELRVTGEPSEG